MLAGLATSAARSLGARSASLLSALVATMVFGWTAQAYADGLLATLLLLEFLELREGDHRASGWLAAACAALTKREGLVLALIVALLVRGWRAWRPLTFSLLPGFVHAVWNGVAGLRHELDSPRFVLSDLPVRLAEIAYRSAAITWHSSTYLLVACGLVVILWTARRRTLPSLTRDAVVVALATSVFILLTFLVTPKPLTWHLNTALPRLALHPAVFGVVAIFALTTPRRNPDPA